MRLRLGRARMAQRWARVSRLELKLELPARTEARTGSWLRRFACSSCVCLFLYLCLALLPARVCPLDWVFSLWQWKLFSSVSTLWLTTVCCIKNTSLVLPATTPPSLLFPLSLSLSCLQDQGEASGMWHLCALAKGISCSSSREKRERGEERWEQ